MCLEHTSQKNFTERKNMDLEKECQIQMAEKY